jgi:hypothetical protein
MRGGRLAPQIHPAQGDGGRGQGHAYASVETGAVTGAVVQIVENWSRIVGRVEGWEPPARGEPGILTLRVARVADVPRGSSGAYANLLQETRGRVVRVSVSEPVAVGLGIAVGCDIDLDVRRGRSPEQLFGRLPSA